MTLPNDEELNNYVSAAVYRLSQQFGFDLRKEFYYEELFDYLFDLAKAGEVRTIEILSMRGIKFVSARIKKLAYTPEDLEVGYESIIRFDRLEYDKYLNDLDQDEQLILNLLVNFGYDFFKPVVKLTEKRGINQIDGLLKRALEIRMTKLADAMEASIQEDNITRKLLIIGRLEAYDPNLAKLFAICGPEWIYYFSLIMGGQSIKIPHYKDFIKMIEEVDEFRKSPETVFKYGKWRSLAKLSDRSSFSGMMLDEYMDRAFQKLNKLALESDSYDKVHNLHKELMGTYSKIVNSIKELSEFESKLEGSDG